MNIYLLSVTNKIIQDKKKLVFQKKQKYVLILLHFQEFSQPFFLTVKKAHNFSSLHKTK